MTDNKQNDSWNEENQTYHAGQSWRFIDNFTCDFSTTCNGLGTPTKALESARESLESIHHYPAADFEPALSNLAKWLVPETDIRKKFTLGNGASELIDIITRLAPRGPWRPGPNTSVQYKEYERSASADEREILSLGDQRPEAISAIVNPCNPTGAYLDILLIKEYLSKIPADNSFVLVDESMLMWYGPDWRSQSLTSDLPFLEELYRKKGVAVWVIHSWTKIWACPGIRIGSVVAPTNDLMNKLKLKQVPWSLNTMAIAFTANVVKDNEYMKQTWEKTPTWRKNAIEEIQKIFPTWQVHGEKWLSWIWINTQSAETATKVVECCSKGGTPVRPGSKGYDMDSYIRVGVRGPKELESLLKSLKATLQ